MKNLFISQPMHGKSDEEILSERKKAIRTAENSLGEPVKVLESFSQNFNGKPLQFLAKNIGLLAQADVAYFAPGWESARGCKIEHECSVQYGITRIE
jgi:hypothetical protein